MALNLPDAVREKIAQKLAEQQQQKQQEQPQQPAGNGQ